MAKSGTIAERYAHALFALAEEKNALDAVSADLDAFSVALADSEDLRRLVESPVIRRQEQANALVALCKKAQMSDIFSHFLGVLAQNRRLFAFGDIAKDYQDQLCARRGEFRAEVTTACPLAEQQLDRLRERLAARLGGSVRLKTIVNPAMIGGLRVQIGSRLVDDTLRSKLDRIGLMMKGTV